MSERNEDNKKSNVLLKVIFILVDIVMLKWLYWVIDFLREILHWLTEKKVFWVMIIILGLLGAITLVVLQYIFNIPIIDNIREFIYGIFKKIEKILKNS